MASAIMNASVYSTANLQAFSGAQRSDQYDVAVMKSQYYRSEFSDVILSRFSNAVLETQEGNDVLVTGRTNDRAILGAGNDRWAGEKVSIRPGIRDRDRLTSWRSWLMDRFASRMA